jgi:hypothetical protein
MYSRRDFAKYMAAALPSAGMAHSNPLWAFSPRASTSTVQDATTIHGVSIGLEGYSLVPIPHDVVLDVTLNLMVQMGVRELSMWEALLHPTAIFDQVSKAPKVAAGVLLTPEEKAVATAANDVLKKWRATVSLDYFRDIRKKYNAANINIYATQLLG